MKSIHWQILWGAFLTAFIVNQIIQFDPVISIIFFTLTILSSFGDMYATTRDFYKPKE